MQSLSHFALTREIQKQYENGYANPNPRAYNTLELLADEIESVGAEQDVCDVIYRRMTAILRGDNIERTSLDEACLDMFANEFPDIDKDTK